MFDNRQEVRKMSRYNVVVLVIIIIITAILGFHSMMNQDQYHASLLNKEKVGLGWDGVTKASQPKPLPFEPPNATDPEESILKVHDDDSKLIELCLNNINITDDQFRRSADILIHT